MAEPTEEDSTYEFAPREEPAPAGESERAGPIEQGEALESPPAQVSKSRPKRPPPAPNRPAPPVPPTAEPAAEKPAEAPVERHCPHCGFTYYGKPKARCPECAAPAESAMDLLQFGNPRWVRSAARGWMLVAMAIGVEVAASVFYWLHDPLRGARWHEAGAILLLLAVFVATRSGGDSVRSSASLRWSSRFFALLAALPWVALMVMLRRVATSSSPEDWQFRIRGLTAIELGLQGLVAVPLGFYAADLARRVPSDTLITHTKTAGWLIAIACWTLAGIQAMNMIEAGFLQLFMCSLPLIFGVVVIYMGGLVTAVRLWGEMRAAAKAGELIIQRRGEREAKAAAKRARTLDLPDQVDLK